VVCIFLILFGGLLLEDRPWPPLNGAESVLFLAAGVAFLVSWLRNRGVASPCLGAIITTVAAPDLLAAAGVVKGDGVGMLCLGIAFLKIAGVRTASGQRGSGLAGGAWHNPHRDRRPYGRRSGVRRHCLADPAPRVRHSPAAWTGRR